MTKLFDHHNSKKNNTHKTIKKSVEELASLIKLLMKLELEEIQKHDIELLDELFDADFMMFQLKKILVPDTYINTLYNNVVNTKLERELKRWGLI